MYFVIYVGYNYHVWFRYVSIINRWNEFGNLITYLYRHKSTIPMVYGELKQVEMKPAPWIVNTNFIHDGGWNREYLDKIWINKISFYKILYGFCCFLVNSILIRKSFLTKWPLILRFWLVYYIFVMPLARIMKWNVTPRKLLHTFNVLCVSRAYMTGQEQETTKLNHPSKELRAF